MRAPHALNFVRGLQGASNIARRCLAIRVFLAAGLLYAAAGFALRAQTMAEEKVFGEYTQFWWTDVNGLPQNSVYAIEQTPEGYIWLGTGEGLTRFDGLNFRTFSPADLKVDWAQVVSLLCDRRGTLWIGDRTGHITRFHSGEFSVFRNPPGGALDQIIQMADDGKRNIWMASDASGVLHVHDGRMSAYTTRDGLPSNAIAAITIGPDGAVWAGTRRGLARIQDGQVRAFAKSDGAPEGPVTALCLDRQGNVWAAFGGQLWSFSKGAFHRTVVVNPLNSVVITVLFCDKNNRIWAGTLEDGIQLIDRGQLKTFPLFGSVRKAPIRSIYQDEGGNLWVGTVGGGLCELRESIFQTYGEHSGVTGEIRAVMQRRNGAVLFGGDRGWYEVAGDRVKRVSWGDSVSGMTIGEDGTSDLWLTDGRGLERIHQGKVTKLNSVVFSHNPGDNIRVIYNDRQGNTWIGSNGSGVCVWRGGACRFLAPQNGLASGYITAFQEDPGGDMWIGTMGGVSHYENGNLTSWTTRDGLSSNLVVSFYFTRSGSLWIGSKHGGLTRFKNGRFARVTAENGLVPDTAFQIVEDDFGYLWMSCNTGLYRVALQDLEDCADGKRDKVQTFTYGAADGMLTRECNQASPAGWKSRDGKLWFGTLKGLVSIDPRRMRRERSPSVLIERVTVDGKPSGADPAVSLNPNQDSLDISYTVLRCDRAPQARFKTRMEGLDDGWTDMGLARNVHYSHLPPGNHVFHVIADNGDGVWNENGAILKVHIAAPFYRTGWFLLFAIVTAAIMITVAWRLRVAGLVKARRQQQDFLRQLISSQEQERRRIAGELHDGLAQRLTMMKNMALLHQQSGDISANGNLKEIATEAGEALREVREISHALRPYQLDYLGLKGALEALLKKAAGSSTTGFSYDIADTGDLLSKDAQINLYRVVQECVQNILKHAQASLARITLSHDGRRARLEIVDDGLGFAPRSDRAGLGLTSISERVELLGGKLEIASQPGQGTRILIEIEGASNSSTPAL